MSCRTDKEACYDALIQFIIRDNIALTILNFFITLIIVPFTIPRNLINYFKK